VERSKQGPQHRALVGEGHNATCQRMRCKEMIRDDPIHLALSMSNLKAMPYTVFPAEERAYFLHNTL